MMDRRKSARLVGLLSGFVIVAVPALAWSQIPGQGFRSAFPSRDVPAQNLAPASEEQEPTRAQPLRASAPRAIPAASKVLPPAVEATPGLVTRDEASLSTGPLAKSPVHLGTSAESPQPSGDVATTVGPSMEAAGTTESEPVERVANLVSDEVQQAWQRVLFIWRFPFLKTTDFELSLQVIVGGLFLLWLGQKLARRLSIWLGEVSLRRLRLPPATAAPLQKMSFYFLFGMFGIFSLQLVGVPMTVFTFFGGAIAIGIGFGSQNVMNNFISGLILLIERPIRVGDVIQINSFSGKVSEIGARSTRITTGSNLEVIIPNSTILQDSVVNWTLSDDIVSSKITVGVAYGSPAKEVARLLRQAADGNEEILKSPSPGVSFTDFAADSMQFELSFWVRMSQADRGKVESDLRFTIDELFGDRGIVIAYPQRDVHLNMMRPMEIRLSKATVSPHELRVVRGAA